MKLYNTLTRTKEVFKSVDPKKVTMYVCGPTVYNFIHVGNARPQVVFDTLRRYFEYKDLEVEYLVNFTDIDDKLINKAIEEDKTVKEIADKYIEEFKKDAKGLLIKEESTKHPRATEHISEMVDFISELIEKGFAYESNGDVYFDISKSENYGKLSKKNIEDLISGARVEVRDIKKNPMDFVLWKSTKPGEPAWNSPWGEGRPGWHIECSAMARKYLGDTIDIHAGGEDLQFPHHENEIAQSESLTKKPFANYWLHNAMINIDNKKMSKSEGNFFTVREIGEKYDLEILRFFLLSSHYRSPINFSEENMEQAKNGLERLYCGKRNIENLIKNSTTVQTTESEKKIIKMIDELEEKFKASMEDDLNTADAISSLFEVIRYSNTILTKDISKETLEYVLEKLNVLSDILGLLSKEEEILDCEIQDLIDERNKARDDKDYRKADEIRDSLLERGIALMDSKEGVTWRRI